MRKSHVVALLLVLLLLVSCAAGHNPTVDLPNQDGYVAGFWRGLWQGVIVILSFVASMLTNHVNIYEVHNNGFLYNSGFLIGISVQFLFWLPRLMGEERE